MMRFLTRILSKRDNNLPSEASNLRQEITVLQSEIENIKKILQQQNSAIRDYALANEVLCTEVTMMGKWVMQKIKEEIDSESIGILGYADSDDDEYLN